VLHRAFFYFLCTVSGCDGGNRTRNIAVYTWRFSPLSYDRHPTELRPSSNWATTVKVTLTQKIKTKRSSHYQAYQNKSYVIFYIKTSVKNPLLDTYQDKLHNTLRYLKKLWTWWWRTHYKMPLKIAKIYSAWLQTSVPDPDPLKFSRIRCQPILQNIMLINWKLKAFTYVFLPFRHQLHLFSFMITQLCF
jgi:hypothetical protein